jgi:hypothetical protein
MVCGRPAAPSSDAGYSVHEIAAWSGHMTLKEVERYTKGANQKRLARSSADGLRRGQKWNEEVASKARPKVANRRLTC